MGGGGGGEPRVLRHNTLEDIVTIFNILIAPWVLGGAHRPYMFVFTGEGGDLW